MCADNKHQGAPLYISEIAPPNLRGTLLVLESISIVSGVVIAFWITYGTRYIAGETSFRLPLGLQMVSATLLGVGIQFFPYSPRWLGLAGRNDECLQSLVKLRRLPATDSRIQTEYQGILAEVEFQETLRARHHPGAKGFKLEILEWLDLLKKKMWRRTIVGVGVCFFQQVCNVREIWTECDADGVTLSFPASTHSYTMHPRCSSQLANPQRWR